MKRTRPERTMDPTYNPDPAAIRRDAELAIRPAYMYIRSARADHGDIWHLGTRAERRGSRSGLLISIYYRSACSGRQLGGPWGQHHRHNLEDGQKICPRCAGIAAKRGLAAGIFVDADPARIKTDGAMNIYLLDRPDCGGYDTYDSAVVYAASEAEAREIHPNSTGCSPRDPKILSAGEWIHPDKVEVKFLGTAAEGAKPGVILASFMAG